MTMTTEKPKFTPGPWTLSYDKGSYRDIMTKDAVVCTARIGYVTPETYQANARLIASAPDLYEACEHVFNAVKDKHDIDQSLANSLVLVIKALSKASGKTEGENK